MKKEELISLIYNIVPDGADVVIQGTQAKHKTKPCLQYPKAYEILGVGASIGCGYRIMTADEIKRRKK